MEVKKERDSTLGKAMLNPAVDKIFQQGPKKPSKHH
jgi:hypothetical protein